MSASKGRLPQPPAERAGVSKIVAAHAQARLREVVRAEAEELGRVRDLVRRERAARHFDHLRGFQNHFGMPGGNFEQHLGGSGRLAASLLPILKRVLADAEELGKFGL